ncbi:MAG TPA: GNAT family N-acetyltransferase [Beijerinckiaceae bacterium]|jgi:CelD/BcsL family acetyltransferase involved in cellulose biosynthesis
MSALDLATRRAPAAPLRAQTVDHAWLVARRSAWQALAAEALTPNPDFTPGVIEAHLATGAGPGAGRFVAVARGDALVALLPARLGRTWLGLSRRAAASWLSPYMVHGTPLIAPGDTEAAAAALLDGMAEHGPWRLPFVGPESEAGRRLRAVAEAQGWTAALLSAAERPVLARRAGYEALVTEAWSRNRRLGLARARRRLSALGAVTVETATGGASLAAAVEAFLTLELGGWKGRRGTAMAARPASAALARRLFTLDDPLVAPRADLLLLDGRPVAASLALVSRGTAHLLKTAYDEGLARTAPGLLLEDEIIRSLHATGFAERLDSASLPGTVFDELYPDREPVAELILAPPGVSLGSALRVEAAKRRATTLLKRARR